MHENVKRNWRLSLPLLLVLLSACATPLRTSKGDCPTVPPKPAATQPTPALPYSASARINIEKWLQRLTDTPATPPSVSQPGQGD